MLAQALQAVEHFKENAYPKRSDCTSSPWLLSWPRCTSPAPLRYDRLNSWRGWEAPTLKTMTSGLDEKKAWRTGLLKCSTDWSIVTYNSKMWMVLWQSWRPVSERATSEARAWGPSVAVNMEANPKWHVHMTLCTSNTPPPSMQLD